MLPNYTSVNFAEKKTIENVENLESYQKKNCILFRFWRWIMKWHGRGAETSRIWFFNWQKIIDGESIEWKKLFNKILGGFTSSLIIDGKNINQSNSDENWNRQFIKRSWAGLATETKREKHKKLLSNINLSHIGATHFRFYWTRVH